MDPNIITRKTRPDHPCPKCGRPNPVYRREDGENYATRTTDDAYMGEPYLVVRCPFCHEVRIPDEEVTEELREFFAL